FEPFFTTKPRGEGSGLGLAMVHGFVKQSGGHIRIYSEEGHGTTVKVYLPRAEHSEKVGVAPIGKLTHPAPAPSAKTGETILVVEDNDGVREYAKEVLENLGFKVLEAAEVEEACACLPTHDASIFCLPTWCRRDPSTDACSPFTHATSAPACLCSTPQATHATPSSTRDGSIPMSIS